MLAIYIDVDEGTAHWRCDSQTCDYFTDGAAHPSSAEPACDHSIGHDGLCVNCGADKEKQDGEIVERNFVDSSHLDGPSDDSSGNRRDVLRSVEPSVSAPDLKGFLRYDGEEYVTVEKARKYASSSNAATDLMASELHARIEEEMMRAEKAEAELVRLKEALRQTRARANAAEDDLIVLSKHLPGMGKTQLVPIAERAIAYICQLEARIEQQKRADQPPAPTPRQGQDASPTSSTSAQSSTPERSED